MNWTCEPLDRLSPRALYQALALRSQVFVLEQNCVFLDPDGLDLDPRVWHLLGHGDGDGNDAAELRCYARLLPPGVKGLQQEKPMISRVVSDPAARGAGLGRQLMTQAIAECSQRWPGQAIDINAQRHLKAFYESLGFAQTSEVYDEDGIAHIDMRRPPP